MTTEESIPEERPAPLAWAGWILTALLLGYAALLHRGIGPIPGNLESNWYNPNKFLLDGLLASRAGAAMESVGSALALLALPALATAVAVFFTTRSAVARMLSTSSAIAVAIFVYYGVQAPGVWSFFHWRWSGCVLLFALCLGASLTAPVLAESWTRRSWLVRAILYLPLFAAAVVFERNVTGTDDTLIFAISPWPVVQVFGLEVFASIIAVLLIADHVRLLKMDPLNDPVLLELRGRLANASAPDENQESKRVSTASIPSLSSPGRWELGAITSKTPEISKSRRRMAATSSESAASALPVAFPGATAMGIMSKEEGCTSGNSISKRFLSSSASKSCS